MFIFPRKRFQEHFIRDGPTGSVGTANGSGWMQEDDFHFFLEHFKNHVRPTKEQRALLLLDNHSSHMALKSIKFCRENGIILLTFPPHCTHKLQPMDRAIFGLLKKAINTACDNWMRSNAGKVMSIYDIPSITKTAFDVAITAKNISAGFAATGTWPVNTDIFGETDFLPSQVTDRILTNPVPEQASIVAEEALTPPVITDDISKEPANIEPVASTSTVRSPLATQSNTFSPETIRPLPKAPPRKGTQQNRRKIKSAVLTDSPVKDEIAAIEENRKAKNVKKRVFTDKNAKNSKGKRTNKKPKTKNIHDEEEEDSDGTENECFCLCCLESFANSRPNEKWVQCINCKGWSHEDCTGGELQYECHNCLSD